MVAMKWLAWLLRRRKKDPELVSQMGYIQLIIGDTAAAAVSFRQVSLLACGLALVLLTLTFFLDPSALSCWVLGAGGKGACHICR